MVCNCTHGNMKILSCRLGTDEFLKSVIFILKCVVAIAGCISQSSNDGHNIKNNKTVEIPDCMNITTDKNPRWKMVSYSSFTFYVNDSENICFPLSPQLLHCNLTELSRNEYLIENQTLFHGPDFIAELGDYYMDGSGRAYTCDQPIRTSKTTPRCHYLSLNSDQYMVFPNGSFYIKPALAMVDNPVFTVENQSRMANVCYPLKIQFLNCDSLNRKLVMPNDYKLQINLELHYLTDDQWFQLGDYYFVNDHGDAALCVKFTITFQLLRIWLIVSSICLILSFIYQWMEPRNTSYKKSFLCHNFSLAMACSWYTYTRYQTGMPWVLPYLGRYVKFSIGYFSFNANASWLTIAGYDLWQSFASLNHQHHRSSQDIKRFVYYSIAGWGIPTVLLIAVLTINFSAALQKYLSLTPDIELAGWIHNSKFGFVFFYGPIQIMFCLNGIFFFCTIYQIWKAGENTEMVNDQRSYQLLRVSFKLLIVMGIFWTVPSLLSIMRWFTTFSIRHISDGFLGLQGMALFGFTTVKKEAPELLREKFQLFQHKVKAVVGRNIQNEC